MRRTKRWLAGLLCAVLLVSLLPTAALAADGHWADDAVTTLNGIYGSGVFTASDDVMDLSAAAKVLEAMGCESEKLPDPNNDGTSDFTRSVACEVLADIFALQVPEDKTAIQYLYEKNIINGTGVDADGNAILAEGGSVTKAQFAVITYRVLNSVGGGKGSSNAALKPGTKEYFSWMYLATRVPGFQFSAEGSNEIIDNDTWGTWVNTFFPPSDAEDSEGGNADGSENAAPPELSPETTKLDAAVLLVDTYIQAGGSAYIFTDVTPGAWYYDGVMYLFDHGIVSGYGDGTFQPDTLTTRSIFALILFRAKGQTPTATDYDGLLAEAQTFATNQGYMTPDSTDTEWWNGNITRAEAIVGFVKAFAGNEAASANTDILDRFTDAGSISEDAAPYIAYAVSIGLVNGTGEGALALSGETTRGMAGVLLYRTLIGVDTTKMQDYQENVNYVLTEKTAEL